MDTQRMLREIETEIAKLQRVADVLRGITTDNGTASDKPRGISAAAREKMSVAQKARWAKRAAAKTEIIAKPKRTLSASARKKIAAAQRERWSRVRAQQKKAA